MAVASSSVSVWAVPLPCETPPWLLEPGVIVIRLEPRLLMLAAIAAWAPLPIDISAITALTPITIPIMVSAERSLFAESASRATWIVSIRSMHPPPALRGGSGTPSAEDFVQLRLAYGVDLRCAGRG